MASITLEQASKIIDAGLAFARKSNFKPLCMVVLDDAGHTKAMKREDGANFFRPEIALAKAYGCLAMGIGGVALAQRFKDNPGFFTALIARAEGKFAPQQGGIIIKDAGGEIIGSVGITGDASQNDEKAGMAGIEAAGLKGDPGTA
jgi:uncharacterized protein GlcG (DUF336 family)